VSDKFFPSKSWFWRGVAYFWTAPNSLLGLTVGVIGLCFGGGVSVHRGCLEFHGGLSKAILSRLGVVGMTLGHTILGQTKLDLERVRDHEQVHVRQYEILGPLFILKWRRMTCRIRVILGRSTFANVAFRFAKEAFPTEPHNILLIIRLLNSINKV